MRSLSFSTQPPRPHSHPASTSQRPTWANRLWGKQLAACGRWQHDACPTNMICYDDLQCCFLFGGPSLWVTHVQPSNDLFTPWITSLWRKVIWQWHDESLLLPSLLGWGIEASLLSLVCRWSGNHIVSYFLGLWSVGVCPAFKIADRKHDSAALLLHCGSDHILRPWISWRTRWNHISQVTFSASEIYKTWHCSKDKGGTLSIFVHCLSQSSGLQLSTSWTHLASPHDHSVTPAAGSAARSRRGSTSPSPALVGKARATLSSQYRCPTWTFQFWWLMLF